MTLSSYILQHAAVAGLVLVLGIPPSVCAQKSATSAGEPGPTAASTAETQEAWKLVEARDYAAAEKVVGELLKVRPQSSEAHYLLGYVYYREQRPADSLAQYTAGARIRKPDANDLAVVAMDYILLRDYGDADKWLTKAVEWTPGNALYWYYLGRTKNNEFRFQDAIQAFQQALKLHPNDIRAEYNLGLAYAGLGRNEDAERAYGTAIQWEANQSTRDPQPYLNMGELLLDEQRADAALPYLQNALALDGKNPTIHEQLGRAYERLGELNPAETETNLAIQLAPKVPSLHYELGRIYSKEGKAAQAKQEFARCAALHASLPNDSVATPNPGVDH